tara:strand:- start:2286 stop:2738 length:453 start_codon:yes stop_codon:yes gene_type:complete
MSKKQPWSKDYTGWARTNEGVQVYIENGKIKPPGTELKKGLRGALNISKKGLTLMNDYLFTPPSVRKAKKEGTYVPLTYRDTGPGQLQSLAELTIKGVSNMARNTIDRFTPAPGPVIKGKKRPSVYDTKQDLRIKKEQKLGELEAKYGGK